MIPSSANIISLFNLERNILKQSRFTITYPAFIVNFFLISLNLEIRDNQPLGRVHDGVAFIFGV